MALSRRLGTIHRVRIGSSLLLLLLGCESSGFVHLGLPPIGDAETLILASSTNGALIQTEVVDLRSDPAPIQLGEVGDAPILIEAMLYAAEPSSLGLEVGPLRAPPQDALTRPLPEPFERYAAQVDQDTASAWRIAEATSEVVSNLRIEDPLDYCLTLELETTVDLGTGNDTAASIPAPWGDVILFSGERTFRAGPTAEIAPWSFTVPGSRFGAVARIDDDLIWISTRDGIRRARFDGMSLVSEPVLEGIDQRPLELAGSSTDLFWLDSKGAAFHYRVGAARAVEIYHFGENLVDSTALGIASTGSASAALVRFSKRAVVHVNARGEVDEEEVSTIASGLSAIDDVEGFGLLLGSTAGEVFVREGDAWRFLGSCFDDHVRVFVPGPDGFICAGAAGFNQYSRTEKRFCRPHSDLTVATILFFDALADDRWLLSGKEIDSVAETPALIVRSVP